jgi:hypothetical protein
MSTNESKEGGQDGTRRIKRPTKVLVDGAGQHATTHANTAK